MLLISALLASASSTALAGDGVDSVPGEFATIQQAIDLGREPVIEVAAGRWAGARVTRPVVIHGDPGARITMGASGKIAPSPLGIGFALDSRASGTEIEGFTFECSTSKSLDVGVYGSATRYGTVASDIRIADNTFVGCVQGVTDAGRSTTSCRPKVLTGGEYWLIEGNTFDGFRSTAHDGSTLGGIGVFLFNSQNVDVIDNEFVGAVQDRKDFTTGGVVVAGCRDCSVVGNEFAVTGVTGWWASISNMGYYQQGAAATERLYVADNQVADVNSPVADGLASASRSFGQPAVSRVRKSADFRSFDSFDVDFVDNQGVVFMDHSWCGDGQVSGKSK